MLGTLLENIFHFNFTPQNLTPALNISLNAKRNTGNRDILEICIKNPVLICCSRHLIRSRNKLRHRLSFNNMKRVLVYFSLQLGHPSAYSKLLQQGPTADSAGYFLLDCGCKCWFVYSDHSNHPAQLWVQPATSGADSTRPKLTS